MCARACAWNVMSQNEKPTYNTIAVTLFWKVLNRKKENKIIKKWSRNGISFKIQAIRFWALPFLREVLLFFTITSFPYCILERTLKSTEMSAVSWSSLDESRSKEFENHFECQLKSMQDGLANFIYILLQKVNRFINKVVNVMLCFW